MKYICILFFLTTSVAFSAEHSMLARVTVYWAQNQSATGARLREGHCAVDPERIPYGSRVVFPDGPCTAVDTGPAVVNRKAARLSGHTDAQRSAIVVDRYFETKSKAMAWANAHPHFMNVRVLSKSEKERTETSAVAAKDSSQNNSSGCSQ
jgi:3D (Asp-Asp-Asp) domain-containing protein